MTEVGQQSLNYGNMSVGEQGTKLSAIVRAIISMSVESMMGDL
jgi:hypothetical protein